MAQGYPTEEQVLALNARETSDARRRLSPSSAIACLRMFLAEFFPVGLFALGLLLAIGRLGLIPGIVVGTLVAGAACWLLVRLIAASPILQWIAAAFVLAELAWVIVSFV